MKLHILRSISKQCTSSAKSHNFGALKTQRKQINHSVRLSVHFPNTSKTNGKAIIFRCTLKTHPIRCTDLCTYRCTPKPRQKPMENQPVFRCTLKTLQQPIRNDTFSEVYQNSAKSPFRCPQNTTKTNKPLGAPIGALPNHVKNQWKSNHFSVHPQN